jgi:hypothetical protein
MVPVLTELLLIGSDFPLHNLQKLIGHGLVDLDLTQRQTVPLKVLNLPREFVVTKSETVALVLEVVDLGDEDGFLLGKDVPLLT